MRAGSMPHDADNSFGLASSIRVASSFDAKPPNTTEWIGAEPRASEHREHGFGHPRHVDRTRSPFPTPAARSAPATAATSIEQVEVGERRMVPVTGLS